MIPHLEENVNDGTSTWRQELSMTKLEKYIKGKNSDAKIQLAALNAYEKAALIFYPMHVDLVQEFVTDLSKLVDHPSIDIRKKGISEKIIMIILYICNIISIFFTKKVNSILQWMTLKKIDNARANLLRR